jgi:hydrogenase maturation protease
MTKIALIGLGNILMRDEGVGVWAVRALKARGDLPPEVELVDGGTAGLDLLPYIENRQRVLFVDAVNFHREPGYIGVLEHLELPVLFAVKDSLHHLGLMDVLAAAHLLGTSPQEVCLIGIQPQIMETGLKLSPTLMARLPALVECIVERLGRWNLL